jgi:hypothetical protein
MELPITTRITNATKKIMPYINSALCITFGAMVAYAVYDNVKTQTLQAKVVELETRLAKSDKDIQANEKRLAFLERVSLDADN